MQCQSQHIPGKSQHCHFDEQGNLKFTQIKKIKGLLLYSLLSSETQYNVKKNISLFLLIMASLK